MKNLGKKHPEYDEYHSLSKKHLDLLRDNIDPEYNKFVDVKERMNYIEKIKENKIGETTFTDNNDGKTVTIQRKGDPSTSVLAPELDITAELPAQPENEKIFAVEDFKKKV